MFTYKGRLPKKINLKIDIYEKVVIFGQATSSNDDLIKKVGRETSKGDLGGQLPPLFLNQAATSIFKDYM